MADIGFKAGEEETLHSVAKEVGGGDGRLRAALKDHLRLRVAMDLYAGLAKRARESRDLVVQRGDLSGVEVVAALDRAAKEFDRRLEEDENADTAGLLDTDLLSIREASSRFALPAGTLRRLLSQGRVAGAHKVPGVRRQEWRIPVGSLRALGYREAGPQLSTTDPGARTVRSLEIALTTERRRWAEWDRRLGWATTRIARLESELKAERGERNRLERVHASALDDEIDLTEEHPRPS